MRVLTDKPEQEFATLKHSRFAEGHESVITELKTVVRIEDSNKKIQDRRLKNMGLSYTEELVSEYYRHIPATKGIPKYMVAKHVHYQDKKATTHVKGWSDIDVLAISEDEICIIQTKSFAAFKNTVQESINSAIQYFRVAQTFVLERYDIKNKKIRKIFVADSGLSANFQSQLSREGIEPFKLKDIFVEYLRLLSKLYPDLYHVGKEENNLTRIMIFILYSFEKELAKTELLKQTLP